MIKYAIADDHILFRGGIIAALNHVTGLELVLQAGNGQELIDGLANHNPHVILMDIKMPVLDGIAATKKIRETDKQTKILIVSMHDDEKYILHLLEMGANGYLLKNAQPNEVITAIQAVHENGYYFNDFVNKILLKKLVTKSQIVPVFINDQVKFTSREVEVLTLICQEYTATEIANQWYLSARTIEGIRTKLLEKIGVKNTVGLVMYAVKNGIA